ncbi:hypothetical protein D9M72_461770 [compost metagenome]
MVSSRAASAATVVFRNLYIDFSSFQFDSVQDIHYFSRMFCICIEERETFFYVYFENVITSKI